MSIPLDRLYDYLHNKSNHDMLIYRWMPHGSKKLADLQQLSTKFLTDWVTSMTTPAAIMHDQEPLQFDLWTKEDFTNHWNYMIDHHALNEHHRTSESTDYQVGLHLRGLISPTSNLYDKVILVHSEQNSDQVAVYQQNNFVPVYYWAHALIAADWFRFAVHDPVLQYQPDTINYDFLIYNRAWHGTREYRLTFTEMLANTNLVDKCLTSFSPVDDGHHYTDHQFKNPALAIGHNTLDQVFGPNQHQSSASADYNHQDYMVSGIEVVLETLFDDTRWHLTEKALRPIACGKPFILASTAGSLQYLRSYGFETFRNYINEDYDLLTDPKERLQAIVLEMQRIASLPDTQKKLLWQQLHIIANRNKERFFSEEWQDSIEQEFYCNLDTAITELNAHRTGKYWHHSLSRPLTSGSTGRPAEQIQALHQWLRERN